MTQAPGPRGDPRASGRDALVAWVVAVVLVAGAIRIHVTLPVFGDLGALLVGVLYLAVPMYVVWRRKEDLVDFAFHASPVKRGVIAAVAAIGVIFPLFVLGYFAFYDVACNGSVLEHLVPRNMCSRYGGLAGLHLPELTWKLGSFCALQLIGVALPEELFFRGFLLGLLEHRFPPKRRILGGGIGLALVLSALAFALIHLPKDGDPRGLLTFFPGLLFGWMRSATGSILASTLTHAGANILLQFLYLTVLR